MSTRNHFLSIALLSIGSALLALVAVGVKPVAAAPQKTAADPKALNMLAIGEPEVKQLLLLMDTDRNGKISKKEYMTFMEAEFDRLDKDHGGELDPKELELSSLRVSHAAPVGK